MIIWLAVLISIIGVVWIAIIINRVRKTSEIAIDHKKYKPSFFRRLILIFSPVTYRSSERASIEQSFGKAIKTMNIFIRGKNFKYQLPWFLLIGAEDSGKTTFLNSLLLESPIDEDPILAGHTLCDWRFFNNGIFLDIKGSLIRKLGFQPQSDEKEWFKVMDLLAQNRPKKPLDGILLFVSVTDFVGPNKKNMVEIHQDAEYMYSKLWQLQNTLRIKLPVYIVLTNMDKIDGFKEFVKSMPEENKEDIFGWSSPYAPETVFNASWVDEMFETMDKRIRALQGEIFVNGYEEDNSSLFLFPRAFNSILEPLRLFIGRIFQENTYSEGFFCRGAYFTGFEHSNTHSSSNQEGWPQIPKQVYEKAESSSLSLRHSFATNLVIEKIFPEKNMGRIIWKGPLSYSYTLKALQISIMISLGVGVWGLTKSYKELNRAKNSIKPHLYQINQVLISNKSKKDGFSMLKKETDILIKNLSDISVSNLRFLFLPASWFSRIEDQILSLLQQAYDKIILKSISYKIRDNFEKLSQGHIMSDCSKPSVSFNPTHSKEFCELNHYVSRLNSLEIAANKMKLIKDTGSLEDFAWVFRTIFQIDLPKKFFTDSELYKSALRQSNMDTIEISEYSEKIKQHVETLFKAFIHNSFLFKNISSNLNNLQKSMVDLEKNKLIFRAKDLHKINLQISRAISLINSKEFNWLSQITFNSNSFNDFINKINGLSSLGNSVAESFVDRANLSFSKLRTYLQTIYLPFIGRLFDVSQGRFLYPSSSLMEFQGILNTLFSEKFMKFVNFQPILPSTPGKRMLWDLNILNDSVGLLMSYENFISTKILSFPSEIRDLFKLVAKNNLETLISTKLSSAQRFLFDDNTQSSIVDDIQNIRLGYNSIVPILRQLKALNFKIYSNLRDLEASKLLKLITKIDAMLHEEKLYTLAENEIKMENIIKGIRYDDKDINNYLEMQRGRMEYFAKELVEPIIETLKVIADLQNSDLPPIAQKWDEIIKDLNNYKLHNKSSKLESLEKFIKENIANIKIENIKKILFEAENINPTTSSYFEERKIYFKKFLAESFKNLKKNVLYKYFNDIIFEFKKIASAFPLNMHGRILDEVAVSNFTEIFEKQKNLSELFAIFEDTNQEKIKFLNELKILKKWLSFLANPNEKILLKFLPEEKEIKSIEKNTNNLIEVNFNCGDESLDLTQKGELALGDEDTPFILKFRLANQSKVQFLQIQDLPTYSATEHEAKFVFYKKQLVKLLLNSSVMHKGKLILKIAIPIMDMNGIQNKIVFAVPISIIFQGDKLPILNMRYLKLPKEN